ncbi:MAG: GTP-dependent dephospho-CoA kinase family protein [Candidatus Micrarchaeia archaeon]
MLELPGSLRRELAKNYGKIINEAELAKLAKRQTVISVGDMVTATLLSHNILPRLAIFDFKTKRTMHKSILLEQKYRKRIKVENRPGVITYNLWKAVRKALVEGDKAIEVVGEEDLASLVCIHFAKDGSLVVYGLPGRGIEAIKVNSKTRKMADCLLMRMKKHKEAERIF